MSICSISCSGTHFPPQSSPCAPWKYLLWCLKHVPSPFPHLDVPSAISHPSAYPAFLHFLKHAFTAAPRAQLLCSTSAWCRSVAELPESRTGKPQQFLTDATLQPSPATKTLPGKPKNQGCQVWKCQT